MLVPPSLIFPHSGQAKVLLLWPLSVTWGGWGGLCTPTLCIHTHTHTHTQTGDSRALLTKPFCSILTVTVPFLYLHLPELSQHHPDHHSKPMRAGLRPCSSFLCSAPRLLSTGHVMAMPGSSNCIPACDQAPELQQPQLPPSAPIQRLQDLQQPTQGRSSLCEAARCEQDVLPPSRSLLPSSRDPLIPQPQHIPLAAPRSCSSTSTPAPL